MWKIQAAYEKMISEVYALKNNRFEFRYHLTGWLCFFKPFQMAGHIRRTLPCYPGKPRRLKMKRRFVVLTVIVCLASAMKVGNEGL